MYNIMQVGEIKNDLHRVKFDNVNWVHVYHTANIEAPGE